VLVVLSVLAERNDGSKRIVTVFENPFPSPNREFGLSVHGNLTSYLAEGHIQHSRVEALPNGLHGIKDASS